MAKPSPASTPPSLLVLELWGLGDLALAIPFLRGAASTCSVTVVSRPAAAEVLRHFAPAVAHLPLQAPWTAFRGKYRLLHWPWSALGATVRELRRRRFSAAVSARPDPRDHLLLRLTGASRRLGYPRAGSALFLTDPLVPPSDPHRAAYWHHLATTLGIAVPPPVRATAAGMRSVRGTSLRRGARIVVHEGAAHAVRRWPKPRFDALAARLTGAGYEVVRVPEDPPLAPAALLALLASADRFIGNDSGPGHLAALTGVPTFTLFGPQLPERFHPQHPAAAWLAGGPCPYKPCKDNCRYAEPHCLLVHGVDDVWARVKDWLETPPGP